VLRAADLEDLQLRHWVRNTAVGNVFGMGGIAGFFVGLVVLYEILSTDIRNALPLYATLQAMGYRNHQLGRFVIEQAWIFAALGYLPALALSTILFPMIHAASMLPIFVTPGLALFILLLSFLMCSLAAILSLGRLRRADPAELF